MSDKINGQHFPVRKSPRLASYDYSSPNYYFVTICTKGKVCLFGEPDRLSQFGQIAKDCLERISSHFPQIRIDKWVVMPNHVHLIVILTNTNVRLSTVIGQYKSAVTKEIHRFAPEKSVWQFSFHDHVIRNEADYLRIWAYIDTNPSRWLKDCFYVSEPGG